MKSDLAVFESPSEDAKIGPSDNKPFHLTSASLPIDLRPTNDLARAKSL
jgi:hypothetical protein